MGHDLDHVLPEITPSEIESRFKDFPLPLADGRTYEWLAAAIRRSLAIPMLHEKSNYHRLTSSDRKEIVRLASNAEKLWLELFASSFEIDNHLTNYAWGASTPADGSFDEPHVHKRFRKAVHELDWLASFLREAANVELKTGPQKSSSDKRLRIEKCCYLAPVYEAAFGKPITVNNYPYEDENPTPFAQFCTTLGVNKQDLSKVLKAVKKRHETEPVIFHSGVIEAQ